MKLSLKPIALAVAVTLASAAAHAQLAAPAYGTTAPVVGNNISLRLAVWDPSTGNATSGHGEQVNLGYTYAQVTAASGALTPNSATSPFTTAVNPATGTGSVLQLNFGVVPSFAATFGTGATADYMVVAVNGNLQSQIEVSSSHILTSTTTPQAGLVGLAQNLNGAAWTGTSGTDIDLTGASASNPLNSQLAGGTINGQSLGGAVNSALNFFNLTPPAIRGGTDNVVQYGNAQGTGFWFLSSTGDLTWNVAAAPSPVPLPAAAWLLASGLAGLGAISRRRRTAAV